MSDVFPTGYQWFSVAIVSNENNCLLATLEEKQSFNEH